MGYADTWKVLDEMIADFRGKGINIRPETMMELRSAKTLISILSADPDCVDVKPRIEEYLFNVESFLMAKGETMLDTECVKKWASRLDQASRKPDYEGEENLLAKGKTSLPLNLPRCPTWVRIDLFPGLQVDELKDLANASHLSCIPQEDGGLILKGEKEQIKKFIKNVASIKGQDKMARCQSAAQQ